MRLEIRELQAKLGITALYVTHDQVEAMTLADRIVVMSDGRIEQIGSPMELFNHPINTFVAGFIGSPPMNQIKGTLVVESEKLFANIGGHRLELPASKELDGNSNGRKIVLGVRPEHVLTKPAEHSSAISVELDLVETLGSEALLHTQVEGKPFVVKAETHGLVDHLHAVDTLYFKPEMVKVFDQETGAAFDHPDRV